MIMGRPWSSCLPPRQIFDFAVHNHNLNEALLREHVPDVFDGDMIIFSATQNGDDTDSDPRNWKPYVAGDITVHPVGCGHDEMMTPHSLAMYGPQLNHSLQT